MTQLTSPLPTPGVDSNFVAAPELVNALSEIHTVLNPLIADTGWVNLTVTIGTGGAGPLGVPQARKIGNQVSCRGVITAATGGMQMSLPDASWGPGAGAALALPLNSGNQTGAGGPCTNIGISPGSPPILAQTFSGVFTSGNVYDLSACRWFTN